MKKMKVAIILTSVLLAQTAFAQSLADKQIYAEQERYLAENTASFNQTCQSNIDVSFDWTNFQIAELEERDAAGICKEALSGVTRVCNSSAEGLKAVQDNIKTISCGRETPRKIELKENTLYFGIDFDAANDADAVENYLMNNL